MPTFWTLLSAFAILVAALGLKQLIELPPNQCQMTFMASPPQYVPVRLPQNLTQKFPNYNLYIYAEGSKVDELYHSPPTGIPLLFVHGSSGNRGQARSMGSILQMKYDLYNGKEPVYSHYTIDFDEEISALYGGVLPNQAEFLKEVIRQLSKSWKQSNPDEPFKMVIVGHSMGGVVARSLYLDPEFDMSTIALHIELASPTTRPVAYLDRGIWEFYERVTELYKQVGHVLPPVLSIMGGERDLQVRSILGDSPQGLKLLSESVPLSWASTDHLCIVWCKQLQVSLSRVLVDVAYSLDDREKIIRIINFHLLRKYVLHNSLLSLPKLPRLIEFPQGRDWQEKFEGSWRFSNKKTITATSLMIPVYKELHITIVAYGLRNDDWLFGCTEVRLDDKVKTCLTGVDISRRNSIIPQLYRNKEVMFDSLTYSAGRVYHVNPQDIAAKKFESLVVSVPALLENVVVLGERYLPRKRTTVFDTDGFLAAFFMKKTLISMHLSERAIYHRINLTNFQQLWKVYTVKVHSKLCMDGSSGAGYVRFQNDWSTEDRFFKILAKQDVVSQFPIKLQSTPENKREEHNSSLEFYFDPDCSYDVHIQFDLKTSFGQLVLHYGEGILAYCFALSLKVLAYQLADFGRCGLCTNFATGLEKGPSFFVLTVLPTIIESMAFLPSPPAPLAPYLSRPPRTGSALEALVARIFIYCVANGVVGFVAKTVDFVLGVASLSYCAILEFRRSSWDEPNSIPHNNEDQTSRLQTAVLVVALSSAVGIGGGVGLVATAIIHSIQLIFVACHNVHLEDRKGQTGYSCRWKLQSTLLVMQILCLPLYVPSVLMYLRTYQSLPNDPYVYSAPIFIFLAITVTQPNVPHPYRYYYKSTGSFITALAILCVLVCQEAMFRLCYFQIIIFSLMFWQQNYRP